MSRRLIYAAPLLVVLAVALPFQRTANLPAVAAADIQISRAQFSQYVDELSEPEGYFDTDNFISNETSYPVSYTHLRAHETPEHLVCRLLLEKKKNIPE